MLRTSYDPPRRGQPPGRRASITDYAPFESKEIFKYSRETEFSTAMTLRNEYPKGALRVSALNEKSKIILPKEMEFHELLGRNTILSPYIRQVNMEAIAQGCKGLTTDEFCFLIHNKLAQDKIILPWQSSGLEEITQFMDILSFIKIHQYDFDFMILDWLAEQIRDTKSLPKPSSLGVDFPDPVHIYAGKLIQGGMAGLQDLGRIKDGRPSQTESEKLSLLEQLFTEVSTHCTRCVTDSVFETYGSISQVKADQPQQIEDTVREVALEDVMSYVQPGGIEYRDSLAQLACGNGVDRAIDVGTGYGFLLPALTNLAKQTIGIDPRASYMAPKIARSLHKAGRNVSIDDQTLGRYTDEADVAVVSGAEFLDFPSQSAQQLARIAKHRVVLGVCHIGNAIQHYVLKDQKINSGGHTQSVASYSPLLWKKELEKHFAKVEILGYENRRYVLVADK